MHILRQHHFGDRPPWSGFDLLSVSQPEQDLGKPVLLDHISEPGAQIADLNRSIEERCRHPAGLSPEEDPFHGLPGAYPILG